MRFFKRKKPKEVCQEEYPAMSYHEESKRRILDMFVIGGLYRVLSPRGNYYAELVMVDVPLHGFEPYARLKHVFHDEEIYSEKLSCLEKVNSCYIVWHRGLLYKVMDCFSEFPSEIEHIVESTWEDGSKAHLHCELLNKQTGKEGQ